jgi:DRG Family Regulatory Proteins, Tma46
LQPNYVPTLEDEIEMLRSKLVEDLKKEGKTGTPINPETFAIWQEKKRLKRASEVAKKVEAELRKKKGGKGLSILSGRDLYQYKRELFTKIDEGDGKDDIAMTLPSRDDRAANDVEDDENANDVNDDNNNIVNEIATKVQADLFLHEGDDDLDDILDDDDEE